MSVNEFYKIDLSSSAGAQLLDICRYAPCTEAIIRCAAVIDTPLPAGADDTQSNALLTLQSEAIANSAVNHGWKVTDSQHVSDKDSGKRYLRTVLTPAGLPLAILPEAPQEAQVRLETAVRKVITGEPEPCKFDGNAVSIRAFDKDIAALDSLYADLDEAITAADWRVIEAHINLIPAGDVNTLRVTAIWQPDARKEES